MMPTSHTQSSASLADWRCPRCFNDDRTHIFKGRLPDQSRRPAEDGAAVVAAQWESVSRLRRLIPELLLGLNRLLS